MDSISPSRNEAPDPALAASVIYYAEVQTGEALLGRNLNPAYAQTEINDIHYAFRQDRNYWVECTNRFEQLLNKCSVEAVDIVTYTSQSYMVANSASFDIAAPTVIWGTSNHAGGHWLQFAYGETKVLKYRYECGYQFPAEYFIEVQQDNPPYNPNYVKDPSKDPVFQGNANRGGGYNTNADGSIDWSQGDFQKSEPAWQGGGSSSGGGTTGGGGSSGGGSGGSSPEPEIHIDPQPKDPAIADDPEVHGRI